MEITAKNILESAPRRFRPEKAEGIELCVHFEIKGTEDFSCTITINNGVCDMATGWEGTANCTVKTSEKVYTDLETGKANPQMALMMGKIKVSNISEMMKFSKLFRKFDPKYLEDVADKKLHKSIERPILEGPLKGIKIIDLTRLLPGPLATMFLADMGAEVIKVEDPDSPDYVRDFEPTLGDTSAFYYALNRNKKSLAVNYLSPAGKDLIISLVRTADVLIEQFRPGAMKHFGLDYETLSVINPKLIYASITGYGQESSLSQAAGHDLNYIAVGGLLGTIGLDNDTLVIPGVQIADIAGGSYMTMNAVLAAIIQRGISGKGQHLDIAMTDCIVPLLALPFSEAIINGKSTERGKFQLSGGLANYNVYKCKDEKFIALGSLEPKFWNKFCDKIGKSEWSNEILNGFETHLNIKNELKSLFAQKNHNEWLEFFAQEDICISAVSDLHELPEQKHLKERKMFIPHQIADKTFYSIKNPIDFTGTDADKNWVAPKLGEDTISILKGINLSDDIILKLDNENTIRISS
jgi:crotonobetainyl-CoA:carnitine CoA-transferase CaiB-like acyl-CoA transferase/putative sterol carrier protein